MDETTAAVEGLKGDFTFFSTKDPIRTVYASLDSFVLLGGLSMNSLLIYLIRNKTAKGMEIYKKLLYMSCFMDLIVSFWTFIVQPIPCTDRGYRTIMMNGVFRKSSQPIRYAVYLTWIQLMLFFLITTMSQYVYRFCILCRNGIISAKIVGSLIFVQIFLNCFHAFLLAWADYPRPGEAIKMREIMHKLSEESGISDVEFISFVNAREFRWLMHIAIMCVMFPAVQGMNVLKLKEYNKQVSAALLFQALLPSLEIGAWCIQIFVPLFVTQQKLAKFGDSVDRAVFRYFGITKAHSTIIRIQTTIQTKRRQGTVSIHPQSGTKT
uniref:G protein-coupled receptor n=1 Tax=Meloidogyne javanica TaxID=6303 RepID=A0A915M5I3_MELJA